MTRPLFGHGARSWISGLGGRGGVVANRQIRLVLTDFVREELARGAADDEIPEEIRARFVVDTFLGVLSWSLGHKPALPPERMNEIFRRLVTQGLQLNRRRR